jgi:HSP20 family molecular chaperone IbpA
MKKNRDFYLKYWIYKNQFRNLIKKRKKLLCYNGWWKPKADILENENNFIVEFELPGVSVDKIGLTINENYVILSSIKNQSNKEKLGYYYQSERKFGNFYRRLDIPKKIDISKCSAFFQLWCFKNCIAQII